MILDDIKTALRISNAHFDGEIEDLIVACKLDLKLSGVKIIDDTDALIKRAITIYAKANFGYDNADSEKFQKSYEHLKCSLSLAGDYNSEME